MSTRTFAVPAVAALAAVLAAPVACTPRPATPVAVGRRIAEPPVASQAASPDGTWLAWLSCASRGRAVGGCALLAGLAAGGPAVRVAEPIVPGPGAFAWTGDGTLLAIARRDAGSGAGELVAWRPGADPRTVATGVISFATSPGGDLAFVAGNQAFRSTRGGPPVALPGSTGAFELAVAPAPGHAVAARVRAADGNPELLLWRGDAGAPVRVAREAGPFAFSSDGAWLAVVAGIAPGAGGALLVVPSADGAAAAAPVELARSVGPFQWSSGGARLAWLEAFDARGNAGRLRTARPGEAPVDRGERVGSFEVAPGGAWVAFVRHVTQGGYAAELVLAPAAGETGAGAQTLARDPATFAFSSDGRFLWYRAGCGSTGNGCALFRVAIGEGASASPVQVADGVASFALPPGGGERALVGLVRRDGAGEDLALWDGQRLQPLDSRVAPGSALFLPTGGRRAGWIATAEGRVGLTVADLP